MRIDLPDPEKFRQMIEEETEQSLPAAATGIVTDSREVQSGDLFIAIKGQHADGHDYLLQAQQSGCLAAMVTTTRADAALPQITVSDPATIIAHLARRWRLNFSLPVLGITGSNGKTTTKDLLIHIFSATHRVHGTRGNYNTRLGLPLTLLELTSQHTLSILEMGANQRGDIGYLCNLSLPRYGLITNIAPAHLQGFGSVERVAQTKGELFAALPSDGIAFVNRDDKRIRALPTSATTITYGFTPECDFASDLHRGKNGLLVLTINGYEVALNSYNRAFALNTVAACAVSTTLGISWESFQQSVLTFEPTQGRCEIVDLDGVTVIDDSYNANLESTLSAMDLLTSIPGKGQRIMVLGDMLELADQSEAHHRIIGQRCVMAGIDLLLCYGKETQVTVDTASSHLDARHYDDKSDLAALLRAEVKRGDVVLFKGSRGTAMETIIEEVFSA